MKPDEIKSKIKPEGAEARNYLNALDSMVATERHYRELAAKAYEDGDEEKGDFYRDKQDSIRYLRQKMINIIDWDKEPWCCMKGELKARHNWEEFYQKVEREGGDVEEIMTISRELDRIISDQYEQMLNTEKE